MNYNIIAFELDSLLFFRSIDEDRAYCIRNTWAADCRFDFTQLLGEILDVSSSTVSHMIRLLHPAVRFQKGVVVTTETGLWMSFLKGGPLSCEAGEGEEYGGNLGN